VAILITLLPLGVGAHATRFASPKPVTVVLQGTLSSDQTMGRGTFRASRAFSDWGRFTIDRSRTTLRARWRLFGRRGTIAVSERGGRWTIISGTGTYRGMLGAGTSTVGESVGGFREVWRGVVRPDGMTAG
jgi:hypothetical protein